MKLILFPHSFIPESLSGKTLDIFDSLAVFLPWEMDLPVYLKSEKRIETLYPAAELKPPGQIRSILAGYRQWLEQNSDRSYLEFIRATKGTETAKSESATWEIRKTLSNMLTGSKHSPEESNSLEWNMILHMAREVEEQNHEAERLLTGLKTKKPLLEGSIETFDALTDLLGDIPGFKPGNVFSEGHIRKILNAWFGLFGSSLNQRDILLTCSRQTADFISEYYDGLETGLNTLKHQTIRMPLPLSPDNGEAGKKRIRDLICKITEVPEQALSTLMLLSEETERSGKDSPSSEGCITLKYFHTLSNIHRLKTGSFIKHFSGRILLLIEE